MITLNNVFKTYHAGKPNEVKALSDVNLEVADGGFLMIIGSNGSGKSTLLDLVAGSVTASSGSIEIDGNDVTKLPEHRRSKWIARVFQNPLKGTASELSIIDNFRLATLRTRLKGLSIGINNTFKNQVKEKISTLGLGLEDKIEQPMGTLSGGQRQALTLLMSVMDKCKVLLLDEPTAALDPRSAAIVMRIAEELVRDYHLTAILVTHNLKDAFTYGDRLIQMGEGRVIKDLNKLQKDALKQADLFDWFG